MLGVLSVCVCDTFVCMWRNKRRTREVSCRDRPKKKEKENVMTILPSSSITHSTQKEKSTYLFPSKQPTLEIPLFPPSLFPPTTFVPEFHATLCPDKRRNTNHQITPFLHYSPHQTPPHTHAATQCRKKNNGQSLNPVFVNASFFEPNQTVGRGNAGSPVFVQCLV